MFKHIADDWTRNLRSDEYQQCTGALERVEHEQLEDGVIKTVKTNCCLGVLAEMAHKEGICERWEDVNGTVYFGDRTDDEYDSSAGVLPMSVMNWAGIRTPSGSRGPDEYELTFLNDAEGLTFEQIADIVDNDWEIL